MKNRKKCRFSPNRDVFSKKWVSLKSRYSTQNYKHTLAPFLENVRRAEIWGRLYPPFFSKTSIEFKVRDKKPKEGANFFSPQYFEYC